MPAHHGLGLASPDLFDPGRKAWMSPKPALQVQQFLLEDRKKEQPFNVGLPDLPDRRRNEAIHLELIKLKDRVDDFMRGPALLQADLHVVGKALIEQCRRRQAA